MKKSVSIYFYGVSEDGSTIRWNHLPWIFTLVHVCTGRNLYDVFHVPGRLVHWQDDFLRQVLRCSIFVTAMEFITGIIVNKWFALHVWDYSCLPFQLFGQICLPFYDIVCLSLCCWDLSECQYSAFVIWRRQTTVCEKNYPFKFKI